MYHGKLLGFIPFHFGYLEWHHLYTGLLMLIAGALMLIYPQSDWFIPVGRILVFLGISITVDDIVQHIIQYYNPDYRSPVHKIGMAIIHKFIKY